MNSEANDSFRHPEILVTSRYCLRKIVRGDANKIFAEYGSDANVARYLTWIPAESVQEIEGFVDILISDWQSGRSFAAVISAKDEPDRLLGMVHTRVRGNILSFGYVLASDHWGMGCMTEVLSCVIRTAFTSPAVSRVEAECDADNHASMRVLAKVGMKFEAHLPEHAVHPNISDLPRDCMLYGLNKNDC